MVSTELLVATLINTIFLFVLLIKNLLSNINDKYETIRNSELAILAIAFTQYALTFIIENSNVLDKDSSLFAQQLRYFDWLITTPLLLYTYWKLAQISGYNSDFFLLFIMDIIMIVAGIFAEMVSSNKNLSLILYLIGCAAYVVIFIKVTQIMNYFRDIDETDKKNLGYFFLIGWLIYPIGYFFNDNIKYILYSVGDFINKGLYSISLNNVL
jgi:bacteriorhodopsin